MEDKRTPQDGSDRSHEHDALWQATFDLENTMQHLSTYREHNDDSEKVWDIVQEAWTALLKQLEERFGKRPDEWDVEAPMSEVESKLNGT